MRGLMLCILSLASIGCNHCFRPMDSCEPCPTEKVICEETRKPELCIDTTPECERPCPPKKAPPPCVEVKQPETIHVKLPKQKIVVQSQQAPPAPAQAMAMQPPMMAQPQMMMMPVAEQSGFAQSVAQGARPGFTFDFIRIPIPFPKMIAVPTAPALRPVMGFAAPQAYAVPQAYAAPQAMAPPPVMAHAAPQAQVVPVQGHAVVPVQGQAVVPVQGQAVVPVHSQAMVQGQSFVVQPQAAAPVQSLDAAQIDAFCRQVEALKEACDRAKLQQRR